MNKETAQPIVDLKGGTVTFGSYPQSQATDIALIAALTDKAGALPTEKDAQKWTSYEYYIRKEAKDFMWYIDVEHDGKKYRGVYFALYRPYAATVGSAPEKSMQPDNGYDPDNIYWFKFEPIAWKILTAKNGEALILADVVLDSRQYYFDFDEQRTIDGKTVYANNYAHSDIRAWLNNDFYNTAFDSSQKAYIMKTLIDNSPTSVIDHNGKTAYACENTEDNVFLLSRQEVTIKEYGLDDNSARRRKTTAYAQCQGAYAYVGDKFKANGRWWLRSPNIRPFYADYVSNDGRVYGYYVHYTRGGVCPALNIALNAR